MTFVVAMNAVVIDVISTSPMADLTHTFNTNRL